MKALVLLFCSLFVLGSLQANSGETLKEADQIRQELPQTPTTETPAQSQSKDQAKASMHKEALDIEKLAEEFEKHYNILEKQTDKGDVPTHPKHLGCFDLPLEEQTFANGLAPGHQKAFCKTFSPQQRKTAMLMEGQPDKTGKRLTPTDAVDLVAKENGLVIPKAEPHHTVEEPLTLPPPPK